MKENKINILYVDDEINNLVAFKANLRTIYEVHTAESATEGLEILKRNTIHVIITDQRMPNVTGIEFLESIIPIFPDPIRILLTGYADIQAVIEAINKGRVYRYLNKPCSMDEIKMTIENAYEIYSLREENQNLMQTLLAVNKQLEFMIRQRIISIDSNPEGA